MNLAIKASVLYFPLVLMYKLFGDSGNNYWVNYFWFLTSIYMILVFIDVLKNCVLIEHQRIALTVVAYWAVMASIRLYLFFNIEKHYQLISSAGKLTIGCVSVIVILIYLTAKTWRRK